MRLLAPPVCSQRKYWSVSYLFYCCRFLHLRPNAWSLCELIGSCPFHYGTIFRFWTLKRIAARRAQEVGWARIAAEMGVGVGTIYRVTLEGSKTREQGFWKRGRFVNWPICS